MKRAKNLYIKSDMPKTGTFYNTGLRIKDCSNKEYEVYQRGKSEHYNGIPIGENDVGLIIKGYFVKMTSGNALSLNLKQKIKRIEDKITTKNNYNLFDNGSKLIEQHKQKVFKKAA